MTAIWVLKHVSICSLVMVPNQSLIRFVGNLKFSIYLYDEFHTYNGIDITAAPVFSDHLTKYEKYFTTRSHLILVDAFGVYIYSISTQQSAQCPNVERRCSMSVSRGISNTWNVLLNCISSYKWHRGLFGPGRIAL